MRNILRHIIVFMSVCAGCGVFAISGEIVFQPYVEIVRPEKNNPLSPLVITEVTSLDSGVITKKKTEYYPEYVKVSYVSNG